MNPEGHFGLTLHNEARHSNADYDEAIRQGKLDELLREVGVQERHESSNKLFDTWLTFLFFRSGWSGCPTPPNYFGDWTGAGAGISAIYLTYYDDGAEPEYTDTFDPGYYDEFSYNCGLWGCYRWMDQNLLGTSPEVWCDTTDREQIFIRFRWFFYPYDVTSNNNNIRGVWVIWSNDVSTTYSRRKQAVARVRFKDEEGNFVRIHKTNYQAMSLEYTFSMLTV